jgi:predicted CoA-binding protein
VRLEQTMVVAIVGASRDRSKFGNKAVRAHVSRRFDVYPVNLTEDAIEGLRVYHSVLDIPVDIDRVSVYLSPDTTIGVIEEIAKKGTKELYLNPGSADDRVVEKARSLGIEPILDCGIIAIGESPADY